MYYVMNSITLQPTSANLRLRTSALRINGNVKLIFLNNSTLTVQGGRAYAYNETYTENGSKKTNYNIGGAGAGIYLPSGSTLTVDGQGTLNATGGAAGDGEKGGSGTYGSQAGTGGRGGYGGGGAGAGIGTAGASGGSYGSGGAGKSKAFSAKASDGSDART